MLITRASEYAILSLIVLAKSGEAMDSEKLSNQLSIPKSFLAKLLQALARKGILNSYKGVNGGFALALDPKDINMLDIMSTVESKGPAVFDCTASTTIESCPMDGVACCTIWPFFNKLQGKIDTFLKELTLADILE
ncbi:MAG: Rrf2 family transcriptional regulator [Sulfurimonas sp.]|jgi:Rrf2 family protein|nr:Rrf2 family transcriptional regulator [Sulfurimonadaceae bacterium]